MAYTVRFKVSWAARRLALAWSALLRAADSFAASVCWFSAWVRNRSIAKSEATVVAIRSAPSAAPKPAITGLRRYFTAYLMES